MGLYEYSPTEHEYLRKMYAEANHLLGSSCKYYQPITVVKDTSNDPNITFKLPVDTNLIFEDKPKPVLKSLNWYAEDDDILPIVAYVSSILPDGSDIRVIRRGIIELPYKLEQEGTQKFFIDKVSGDTVRPFMWTCKLVPYREQVDFDPDTPEIDDSYVEGDNTETGQDYINMGDLL